MVESAISNGGTVEQMWWKSRTSDGGTVEQWNRGFETLKYLKVEQ